MVITGTNNIPLGKRRFQSQEPTDEMAPPSSPPPPPPATLPPPPPRSEHHRESSRDQGRHRDRSREQRRGRSGDRDRDRGRGRGRSRDRSYDRGRHQGYDRSRERSYRRNRDHDHSRSRERRCRSRRRSPRDRSRSQADEDDGLPKRKTRWGSSKAKVIIPGLPTTLPSNMPPEQVKNYLIFLRLEEIGAKLRSGDFIPPEDRRSPSPEPVYNTEGKRVNTRDARYRKKLEDERHKLIETALKENPDFKPPSDYKRPTKLAEKFFIPAKEHPEINFIGLLIGPRGNTLKKMETESGCKISIRGKGSVKEGRRNDAAPVPGIDEDLHCLITGDSEEKIKRATIMIQKIIETSSSVPEGQNELKRQQLRELASLNGTLRDDENQVCPNCGTVGHRRFECPESLNFTVNLVCRICNGVGHTARDCMQRNDPVALEKANQRNQQLDSEYSNLMKELGEDVPANTAAAYGDPMDPNAAAAYNNIYAGYQSAVPADYMGGGYMPYGTTGYSASAQWAYPTATSSEAQTSGAEYAYNPALAAGYSGYEGYGQSTAGYSAPPPPPDSESYQSWPNAYPPPPPPEDSNSQNDQAIPPPPPEDIPPPPSTY
ncbi:hypothetical protein DSO57_1011563 [Entomophthora muscae]|uniref:Uncharacterized protein n=1 Tax=Entomophthora muscae TaxID=34485 RepID=A0ACC2SV07_9FUNG|nr:hypothetical protein DSO57_1011563 [Entomophthora muscae]